MLLVTTWENGVTSGRLPETLLERESPQPDSHAWENAAIWVPIRGFVSRHLSMSLGFFRCRAPHTLPKEVGLYSGDHRADVRHPPIPALLDCGRDVGARAAQVGGMSWTTRVAWHGPRLTL